MTLRPHKTRIVCTVGPASASPEVLQRMVRAGMDVARLNFSHGDLAAHRQLIEAIRTAAASAQRRVAILADLPGPKLRIGELASEPMEVQTGAQLTLTTEAIEGQAHRIAVSFSRLPDVVKPGDVLFINDGLVQLRVSDVKQPEVLCEVVVGGELRSRKGLNLPGLNLGIPAFTERDRECLEFALAHGVDAVGQSFVETAEDVLAVREAASRVGGSPFVIAKIERARALDQLDPILEAADGIMLARGDLGVEIPIEGIGAVQKQVVHRANRAGKPVITATQMLESMVTERRPTRAEVTDVANAVLDGTDCVMLSAESAAGRYPVEAVEMLARIAAATEPHREYRRVDAEQRPAPTSPVDLIAASVNLAFEQAAPVAVLVPTVSGHTARSVARFRLPVWVTALSPSEATCQGLQFSYGVHSLKQPDKPSDWREFARSWLEAEGLEPGLVVLAEGPSPANPSANHRVELFDLRRTDG
jgi:pyruvate kinase